MQSKVPIWLLIFFAIHATALLTSIAALNVTTIFSILYFLTIFIQSKILKKQVEFVLPPYWYIFFIYAALTIVSSLINYPDVSFKNSLVETRWVLSFCGMYMLLRKLRFEEKYLRYVYIVLIFIGAYSCYQYYTGADLVRGVNKFKFIDGTYRATGFFSNPIRFSNVLLVYFCFLFSLFLLSIKNRAWDILKLISFIAVLVGLYCTQVRGAWIVIPIVVAWISYWHSKKYLVTSLCVLVIGVVLLHNTSKNFQHRLESTVDLEDTSNSARIVIWSIYYKLWQDNMWFGVGSNQSGKVAPKYASPEDLSKYPVIGTHAHNQPLNILAEFGIFTFIVWLASCLLYLRRSIEVLRAPASVNLSRALLVGASGAIIGLMFTGLTEANLSLNEVTATFVLVLSVVAVTRERCR